MRTLLICLALSISGLAGCGKSSKQSEDWSGAKPGPKTAEKKWTREEARKRLYGKTQDEVKKELGKPADTVKFGDHAAWFYRGQRIVWDPAAEKYISFHVEFDGEGRCIDVK
jgi:hypothetical protein